MSVCASSFFTLVCVCAFCFFNRGQKKKRNYTVLFDQTFLVLFTSFSICLYVFYVYVSLCVCVPPLPSPHLLLEEQY